MTNVGQPGSFRSLAPLWSVGGCMHRPKSPTARRSNTRRALSHSCTSSSKTFHFFLTEGDTRRSLHRATVFITAVCCMGPPRGLLPTSSFVTHRPLCDVGGCSDDTDNVRVYGRSEFESRCMAYPGTCSVSSSVPENTRRSCISVNHWNRRA